MEHKIILGGSQYLPLARSELKRLRATGLRYATKRLVLPDAIVTVRVSGEHDYIRLEGGMQMFSVGIESNRIVVRTKTTDVSTDWRVHSTFTDAYSDPLDIVPATKLSDKRYLAVPLRTENTPGASVADPTHYFLDGFGKGKAIYDGPKTVSGGDAYAFGGMKRIVTTDATGNAFILVAVATDHPTLGAGEYQAEAWRCDSFNFTTRVIGSKPAMWAFTYDPSTHGDRGLKTLPTESVVYVGNGRFVYGLGGSSLSDGTRDADHKMVIVVTQDFNTFTAYDVEAGLGGVFGAQTGSPDFGAGDFSLGGCCYIGNGKVMFGGYGTDDMIVFDSATGGMTRVLTSDIGWSTSKPVPMPMGDDSACYFRYVASATSNPSDLEFVYTTDLGVTWHAKPMLFRNPDTSIPTVDNYFGTVTVRKPLTKNGATITSNGELIAILHVPGTGHVEFRTTDLGVTWTSNGVVSATAADPSGIGMTFRHVLVGAPRLSLNWG